jgi:O-antigen/teichoic acid export membrane protein
MAGLRRAFLLTSLERYVVLALNFGVVAIVSRLLTPAEVGLAVLGTSLLAVAETLRDFGTGSYLIQQKEVGRDRVRTAFTVMAIVSGLIVAVLMLAAGPLATLYGEDRLAPYLRVIALGFLAGPVSGTILALLRRDMQFGAIVLVNMLSGVAGAVTTVGLVLAGQGYMSFAWGGLAWCASAAALAVAMRPDLSIFRFQLTEWRSALAFGGYNSATAILNRLYEVLPYLALGRMQPAASVGLFNRALLLCQLPDRALLSGVVGVALPALAAEARDGRPLKAPYLRALGYITAVQWPALLLVALLAHPAVELLLGRQWLSIVPLVQVMAVAQLMAFAAPLTYPVLVAAGGVRDTLTTSLITLPPSALILLVAAGFGLQAVAASFLLIIPLQVGVALVFIRRRIRFGWGELVVAIAPSATVAACTAVLPVLAIALHGFQLDLPLPVAILAALGGAVGWVAGLLLARHPLAGELRHLAQHLPAGQRALLMLAAQRGRQA